MTNIDNIIKLCQKTAMKSPCKYKVSCVLVDRNGNVVSTGFNFMSVNSKKYGTFSIHAEMNALSKVRKPSNNLTAFIYRKNGRPIHPCPTCLNLLRAYGIKNIWHSDGEKLGILK